MRRRRLLLAGLVYVVCVVVFALAAGRDRLVQHTSYNHYAHLADAWVHGRQDLRNGAPAYAGNNDFAEFEGKTFISFPPFPAVLMAPFVAAAGSPEEFRDGQFLVWIAGVGPALLFLVLEKLRRSGRSPRSEKENLGLAFLFAFGSVYFFCAVEGTVWFAAHVTGVAAMAGFLLASLDADHPVWAGTALACAWTSRPAMLLAGLFFAVESLRASCREKELPPWPESEKAPPSSFASLVARARTWFASLRERLELSVFARRVVLFAVPLALSFAVASWMNATRYHNPSPFAFGHEHLSVVWKERMARWGLFSIHFLPKNLGVSLTILPWLPPKGSSCMEAGRSLADLFNTSRPCTPFRINEHGLALWFTTPIYAWLLWPKRRSLLFVTLAVAAALPAVLVLHYQNSGWRQFGYRFSNDYGVQLFVLLALCGRPFGGLFKAAAAWSVVWNLFGAVTFDKSAADRFYFREGSQTILYQAD